MSLRWNEKRTFYKQTFYTFYIKQHKIALKEKRKMHWSRRLQLSTILVEARCLDFNRGLRCVNRLPSWLLLVCATTYLPECNLDYPIQLFGLLKIDVSYSQLVGLVHWVESQATRNYWKSTQWNKQIGLRFVKLLMKANLPMIKNVLGAKKEIVHKRITRITYVCIFNYFEKKSYITVHDWFLVRQ